MKGQLALFLNPVMHLGEEQRQVCERDFRRIDYRPGQAGHTFYRELLTNAVTVGYLKAGTAVEIYDTAGRRVYRCLSRRISLEGKGIYLLKAGHAVRKIRI